MKRYFFIIAEILIATACHAQAKIQFDKTTHDFGEFSEATPVKTCTFTFTNVGNEPLVINQAVASCGCTVPEYSKEAVQPGEKGTITVTYNGRGKYPGHFKKSITIRSNSKNNMTRIYVMGNMVEIEKKS
ncbi:MAG: DUF1573 domain-containing protein [Prevotella sp.]|nr:DUF1573 domain-containing protein [Candidatus Equicola stercoris]